VLWLRPRGDGLELAGELVGLAEGTVGVSDGAGEGVGVDDGDGAGAGVAEGAGTGVAEGVGAGVVDGAGDGVCVGGGDDCGLGVGAEVGDGVAPGGGLDCRGSWLGVPGPAGVAPGMGVGESADGGAVPVGAWTGFVGRTGRPPGAGAVPALVDGGPDASGLGDGLDPVSSGARVGQSTAELYRARSTVIRGLVAINVAEASAVRRMLAAAPAHRGARHRNCRRTNAGRGLPRSSRSGRAG